MIAVNAHDVPRRAARRSLFGYACAFFEHIRWPNTSTPCAGRQIVPPKRSSSNDISLSFFRATKSAGCYDGPASRAAGIMPASIATSTAKRYDARLRMGFCSLEQQLTEQTRA